MNNLILKYQQSIFIGLLALLAGINPLRSNAEIIPIIYDGINYNINEEDGTASVGENQNLAKDNLFIPDNIMYEDKYYPVTRIEDDAFSNNEHLTGSLIIGNCVIEIGKSAFFHCINMKGSLTLGKSVAKIDEYAFCSTGFIGELILPDSLNKIGQQAFYDCRGFSGSLVIPASVGWIYYAAFMNCSGFNESLTIMGYPNLCSLSFHGCHFETIFCKWDKYNFYPKNVHWAPPYPETGDTFSDSLYSSATIYVPYNMLNKYKEAYEWKNFSKIYPIKAGKITLDKGRIVLNSGESYQLLATIEPETAFEKTVYWSVDDEEIAIVDDNGVVTAKKPGTTIVTATTGDNIKATCTIISQVLPTSIVLNYTDVSLKLTEKLQLTATVLPVNASYKAISWRSSDDSIVTVDEFGLVTPAKLGEAVITAITANNVTANCKVTVTDTPVDNIILSVDDPLGLVGNTLEMKVGDTNILLVTIEPTNATDQSVSFKSSNPEIVSVSSEGKLTALSLGDTEVSVTAKSGVSAFINVKVVPTPVASVILTETVASLKASETFKLTAIVLPENATDKSVIWASSDESVATVDEHGMVSAVSVGVAVITASCGSVSATCYVTVVPTPAESVLLDRESAEMKAGETLGLTAIVLPENATDKSVIWASSDESVATVDEHGMVSAVSVGVAVITASCGSVSATCYVTVVPTPAESVLLDRESAEMKAGETLGLTAIVLPENATDKSVTWASSDDSVATVDEYGLVTGIGAGVAIITATTINGLIAECSVIVSDSDIEVGISGPYSDDGLGILILEETDAIRIVGECDSDTTVTIYDLSGTPIAIFNVLAGKSIDERIYRNTLGKGVYLIRIGSANTNIVRKFIS